MSIVNLLEIAERAEEKAEVAIRRNEEAINACFSMAADITKLSGKFDALELLVRQALQKLGYTTELMEAQRRLDSLRAHEFKAVIERSKNMNNKWVTGIGLFFGAGGAALEFLGQQHVGGAIAMAVGVALASLGKSFLGSGQ